MWQDIVILAGSIVAIASLFPTLLDEEASVPHKTSVPTLIVLSTQGVAFYTMGLVGSAAGASAGFAVWSLIAYYKAPDSSVLSRSQAQGQSSTHSSSAVPHAD